jgi:hypothetical protein
MEGSEITPLLRAGIPKEKEGVSAKANITRKSTLG